MLRKERPCRFCGALFRPDRRVGARQYACSTPACQAQRKRACQERWLARHPDYFSGQDQYRKKRPWHEAHPGYLAQYRKLHPEAAERHRKQERQRRQRRQTLNPPVDIQDESGIESPILQHFSDDSRRVDIQDEIPLQRSILLGLIDRLGAGGRVDIPNQIDLALRDCYNAGRRLQTRRAVP